MPLLPLGMLADFFPGALDPQTLRAWRQHMVEHTGLSLYTINRRLSAVKRVVRASVAAETLDQGIAFRFGPVERVPLFSLRQRLRQHRQVCRMWVCLSCHSLL